MVFHVAFLAHQPPPPAPASKRTAPKPTSTKSRPRSPSPSPLPVAPPPPLQTIRLDIVLGGPERYEVDVAALARATGQRPQTPPLASKRYESESEGEGEAEGEGDETEAADGKKKARKGKKVRPSTLPGAY